MNHLVKGIVPLCHYLISYYLLKFNGLPNEGFFQGCVALKVGCIVPMISSCQHDDEVTENVAD